MGMGTSPQCHHPKATGHEHPSHLPGLLLTAALLGFTDALLPGAQRVGERRLWGTALGDGMSWSPRCLGTESPSLQPYLGLHRPWLCTLRFLQLRDRLIIALRLIARSYTRHGAVKVTLISMPQSPPCTPPLTFMVGLTMPRCCLVLKQGDGRQVFSRAGDTVGQLCLTGGAGFRLH